MTNNSLDETIKQELGNLEVPYSADDWEKLAALLSNEKSSKGLFSNKIDFSIKPERIPSFNLPKITNTSKAVIGVAVIIGAIIMLYTLFDDPSSKEQNTNETRLEPSQDIREKPAVAVTDSTGKADSLSIIDSSAQQSTAKVLGNTEKNADGTDKKGTGERRIRKVKMEVEEIGGDVEGNLTKPNVPVFKRKRSRDSIESGQNDELPPPTIDREPEITTPSTFETTPDLEEDEKTEGKKKKRSKSANDEENAPKSFRELDSIH